MPQKQHLFDNGLYNNNAQFRKYILHFALKNPTRTKLNRSIKSNTILQKYCIDLKEKLLIILKKRSTKDLIKFRKRQKQKSKLAKFHKKQKSNFTKFPKQTQKPIPTRKSVIIRKIKNPFSPSMRALLKKIKYRIKRLKKIKGTKPRKKIKTKANKKFRSKNANSELTVNVKKKKLIKNTKKKKLVKNAKLKRPRFIKNSNPLRGLAKKRVLPLKKNAKTSNFRLTSWEKRIKGLFFQFMSLYKKKD